MVRNFHEHAAPTLSSLLSGDHLYRIVKENGFIRGLAFVGMNITFQLIEEPLKVYIDGVEQEIVAVRFKENMLLYEVNGVYILREFFWDDQLNAFHFRYIVESSREIDELTLIQNFRVNGDLVESRKGTCAIWLESKELLRPIHFYTIFVSPTDIKCNCKNGECTISIKATKRRIQGIVEFYDKEYPLFAIFPIKGIPLIYLIITDDLREELINVALNTPSTFSIYSIKVKEPSIETFLQLFKPSKIINCIKNSTLRSKVNSYLSTRKDLTLFDCDEFMKPRNITIRYGTPKAAVYAAQIAKFVGGSISHDDSIKGILIHDVEITEHIAVYLVTILNIIRRLEEIFVEWNEIPPTNNMIENLDYELLRKLMYIIHEKVSGSLRRVSIVETFDTKARDEISQFISLVKYMRNDIRFLLDLIKEESPIIDFLLDTCSVFLPAIILCSPDTMIGGIFLSLNANLPLYVVEEKDFRALITKINDLIKLCIIAKNMWKKLKLPAIAKRLNLLREKLSNAYSLLKEKILETLPEIIRKLLSRDPNTFIVDLTVNPYNLVFNGVIKIPGNIIEKNIYAVSTFFTPRREKSKILAIISGEKEFKEEQEKEIETLENFAQSLKDKSLLDTLISPPLITLLNKLQEGDHGIIYVSGHGSITSGEAQIRISDKDVLSSRHLEKINLQGSVFLFNVCEVGMHEIEKFSSSFIAKLFSKGVLSAIGPTTVVDNDISTNLIISLMNKILQGYAVPKAYLECKTESKTQNIEEKLSIKSMLLHGNLTTDIV